MSTAAQREKRLKITLGVVLGLAVTTGAFFGIRAAVRKKKSGAGLPALSPAGAPLPGESGGSGGGRDELISTRPEGVPPVEVLMDPDEIKNALQIVKSTYGLDIARNVERIYRQETGFKSGQYKNSGSAGMAAFSQTFPYAWKSLEKFWTDNPEIAPVGMIAYKIGRENGKIWRYLAFQGIGGFLTLAEIMKNRGNDPGRYASTDPNSATANSYRAAIAKITPKYV